MDAAASASPWRRSTLTSSSFNANSCEAIDAGGIEGLRGARLVTPLEDRRRGHFLTFETGKAAALHDELLARRIVTDVRGDRIRFGFGCYHAARDIERAVERLRDRAFA